VTRIIDNLAEISPRYRAAFVDLWGCLHNGYEPFAPAVAALERFKATGGIVVLLTNSPRPRPAVIRQLDKIGVPRDLYDDIAASGDASQVALAAGDVGTRIYHLGPGRDSGFFDGLPADILKAREIERVALHDAEGIVCTGLFDDDTETPDDYRETLLYAKAKGMKLLCTNPDIFVDKGDHRIYCAGAIARSYEEMGGDGRQSNNCGTPLRRAARSCGTIWPVLGFPQASCASVRVAAASFFLAASILSLRSRRARETRLLIVPT